MLEEDSHRQTHSVHHGDYLPSCFNKSPLTFDPSLTGLINIFFSCKHLPLAWLLLFTSQLIYFYKFLLTSSSLLVFSLTSMTSCFVFFYCKFNLDPITVTVICDFPQYLWCISKVQDPITLLLEVNTIRGSRPWAWWDKVIKATAWSHKGLSEATVLLSKVSLYVLVKSSLAGWSVSFHLSAHKCIEMHEKRHSRLHLAIWLMLLCWA